MKILKRLLMSIMLVSICTMVCACGEAADNVEPDSDALHQSETATELENENQEVTTEFESEEETTEETVDEEKETNYKIFNNGGTVVKYGDDIYYWKYNSESYEKQAVFAEYVLLATGQNQLVCQKADGVTEILLTTSGSGNLYIVKDKLYFERFASDSGKEVCAISRKNDKWDTTTIETVCRGHIQGVDEEKGIVIVSKNDNGKSVLSVLDAESGQYTDIVASVTYIMYEGGKIYYQGRTENYANAVLGELSIGVADLNGNDKLLVTTTPDMYEFDDGGEVSVQCMQIHNGYVYYSYGSYAGTANYYQGGNICRIAVDGKDNEVLATNAAQEFYVYDENGKTKLIYSKAYDDISEMSVKVIDIDTKDTSSSDMKIGRLNKSFRASDQNYWIYRDTAGVCTSLITTADYTKETGIRTDIKNIEVVEKEVYYTVVYSKYNEAVSIGWRDGYDWVKTEVYKKNLNSGEVKIVYEYTE